ncbi:MAG: DDE-type integrase/transposase/recombinase [Myxococcota bacterium]
MSDTKDAELSHAEAVALFRYGLIADVVRLEPKTPEIYARLREKAAGSYTIPGTSRTRVALDTLRTWVKLYRRHGFDGLKPKRRADRGIARRIPADVVDVLLETKEKESALTVKQVIAQARTRLGVPASCLLPESTVHRMLKHAGLMEPAAGDGSSNDRRKFSFQHAGELWMSDVMHGPALTREGRRKHKSYLIAFLDDATRVISHAEFCWSENTAAFFPLLKKALTRRGLPERLYVDNGAAYRSRQLELVCAKLGISLIHARPYQPQGKGKIERFFRTVRMQFLTQCHSTTLEELNRRFWAWVEGEYHHTPHRGLSGETPLDRWAQASGKLKLLEPHVDVDELFLWEDKRKVRTDRTLSLRGQLYEAVAELVRQNVVVRYDPSAPAHRPIQVWFNGKRFPDAKPLDAQANCFVKRNTEPDSKRLDFTRLDAERQE